ncbi:hypothetical protein [Mycobacterium sp. 94-17]|uniref:hypothetical protein n=1 Tax=Mycobacterium sp. 94-17 TaxID=2986147 RepID=UPI002D1EB271|nr:hypothetical protein [Mycobacterium sp. 94-17]MEB4212333.1 hypothetical protein [Mycobacterium sp. 94-17]
MKIVNPSREVAHCADCGGDVDTTEHPVIHHEFQGNWHCVTYKRTQVSVNPSGEIQLNSHVRHMDVEELVVALRAAVPVAAEARANAQAVADAQKPVQVDRKVLSERLLPSMPALPGRAARPAFTSERLAAARAKLRGQGGSNDNGTETT